MVAQTAPITEDFEPLALMERESPPYTVKMMYYGAGQPVSIVVSSREGFVQVITPENQTYVHDAFNHPTLYGAKMEFGRQTFLNDKEAA